MDVIPSCHAAGALGFKGCLKNKAFATNRLFPLFWAQKIIATMREEEDEVSPESVNLPGQNFLFNNWHTEQTHKHFLNIKEIAIAVI